MKWNDLSLSQKSELFKYYTKAGITNLSEIQSHYNLYANGGDIKLGPSFIDSIKSGIKKIKGISDVYNNSYDARNENSFQDAYKKARSSGNKTFVWNDSLYNTDYKSSHLREYKDDLASGKVELFEASNPGKTYPALVKAKLEELDTYGITNEFTKDKGFISKKLKEEIYPRAYQDGLYGNATRVLGAILGEGDYESKNKSRTSALDNDRHLAWGMYLGYPQTDKTFSVSEYKPKGAELDYYFKYNNYNESVNTTPTIKSIESDKSIIVRYNAAMKKFGKVGNKLLDEYDLAISRLKFNPNKTGNLLLYDKALMGKYTRGKTDEYTSYYDKWDINPLGAGNDKPLFEFGTPINIYDRKYAKGGPINDVTDHPILRPLIPESVPRTFTRNRKWEDLSKQELLNIRLSKTEEGRPLEKGLDIVSPEFDIIGGVRGLANIAKNVGLKESSNNILRLGETLDDVRPLTLQELYFRLFDDIMHKPLKKAIEYGRDKIVEKTGSDKARRLINGSWNAYRSGVKEGKLPAYYQGIGAAFMDDNKQ